MTSEILDRARWLGQRTVKPFGYNIRFRWSDPSLEIAVNQAILPDWPDSADPQPDATFSLYRGAQGLDLHHERGLLVNRNAATIAADLRHEAHLDLATYAPGLVFVHAGVVLVGSRLLLMPGRSFSGKSTLVRALVDLGCPYYSDEYAVVREDGAVLPFPRDLCERTPQGERHTPACSLGWSGNLGAARVAAIACTRYAAGASWKPEVISVGQALLEVLTNTVSGQTAPRRALQFLSRMAQEALCLRGDRPEAEEAARAILRSIEGR